MFRKKNPEVSTSEAELDARIRREMATEFADQLRELADEVAKKFEAPEASDPAPTPEPPKAARGHGAPGPKRPDTFL